MSSLITTINNAGSPQPYVLDDEMIPTPQAVLLAQTFAWEKVIKERSGTILRQLQARNIQVNTNPIAPGSQGQPPQPLLYNTVDGVIQNYGNSIYVDVFNMETNQYPLAAEAGKRLIIALMQAEDTITWTMLAQATTQYKCVQGGNGDDPTETSYNDTLTITDTLAVAQATPVFASNDGSLKFGSAPNQAAYWAYISTALRATLRANSQFLPVERYSHPVFSKEELGSMGGMRFMATTQAPIYPNLSSQGQIIFVGAVGGAQTYTSIHLEGVDKTVDFLPSQYTGPNMQQCLFTGRNIFGTSICQTTWVASFLSTASVAPSVVING
jgi:N4-gp56 family major capsid protein